MVCLYLVWKCDILFFVCYIVCIFLCNVTAQMEERGGKELLVAKLLIAHINNNATRMLNKSEPLETYPSDGFRWNLLILNRV